MSSRRVLRARAGGKRLTEEFEAVLFDFGGVFTDSPFDAVETAGREIGAGPGVLSDIVFGPYHRDTDHPWHRLERGEISLLDARGEVMEIARRAGFEIDPFELLGRSARAGVGARQNVVDCVRRVRASGYRTALLTNNVREFDPGWRSLIPVDEIFERVVDSSAIGVRKPDPEIYRIALRELGDPAPQCCIFLDDCESNLDAATRLGIHSVRVDEDPAPALAELERLLA